MSILIGCHGDSTNNWVLLNYPYNVPEYDKLQFIVHDCYSGDNDIYEIAILKDKINIRCRKPDGKEISNINIKLDENKITRINSLIVQFKNIVDSNGHDQGPRVLSTAPHVLTLLKDDEIVVTFKDQSGGGYLENVNKAQNKLYDSFITFFKEY